MMEKVDFTNRRLVFVYKFAEDAVADYLRDEASEKASLRAEDFGIGSYEYWGCRGYDSQMGIEIGGESEGEVLLFCFLEEPVDEEILREYNAGEIDDEVSYSETIYARTKRKCYHEDDDGEEIGEAKFTAIITGISQEINPEGQVRAAIKFRWKVEV